MLAKEFSEDPGSASRGGDLDWLSLGTTAPAFEKMMLASPIDEISPIFESEFGFHFLQVLDKRTEDLTEELSKTEPMEFYFLENLMKSLKIPSEHSL